MNKDDPDYTKVISYCDLVIDDQPTNAKAHFRKGVSLYNLKDYDTALTSFLKAKDSAGAPGLLCLTWGGNCKRKVNQIIHFLRLCTFYLQLFCWMKN